MYKSYFIWNGADCRAKGVTVQAPAQIVRGEERVSHVTIPGRSGELTLTEGEGIFQSYIQTLTIQVQGWFRVREILKWLTGSGYVTFGTEPDRRQKARVIGAVSMNRHSKNTDFYTGEVQFYCEPLKESMTATTTQITASGSSVMNAGDVACRPKITATASATTMTITAGGETLTITGLTSSNDYVIDCEAGMVTNADGSVNLTANSSGSFPELSTGQNAITGSGWSKLVFERRERFL